MRNLYLCILGFLTIGWLLVSCGSTMYQAPANQILISDIQGNGHVSAYDRQVLENIPGIITAVQFGKGFFMQNPSPDNDPATSEGIFVQTRNTTDFIPGMLVLITGKIEEYYPGGREAGGLPITRIRMRDFEVYSDSYDLPEPIVIGPEGRMPPDQSLYAGGGNVLDFPLDIEKNGIDFYESLEHMYLEIKDPVVRGSIHTAYGEFYATGPDWGSNINERGGMVITEDDENPEALMIDIIEAPPIFEIPNPPMVVVGDSFSGPIRGVLDYSFGRYKMHVTEALPPLVKADLPRETTDIEPNNEALTLATFNVLNLDPNDPMSKFKDFAETIANAMNAPDVVVLQEIQDNNGPMVSEITSADKTAAMLIAEIAALGGPEYIYTEVLPESEQDGGEPGGNIRVGFLYNPERIELSNRGGPGSYNEPAELRNGLLQANPVRIAPDEGSFVDSRKPLLAEFIFQGKTIYIIGVHFVSKGGDNYDWARLQPPNRKSEDVRLKQASLVAEFAENLVAQGATVIIAGDMNEYYFRSPLRAIEASGFVNTAIQLLGADASYSYVFQQNSQALDHIYLDEASFDQYSVNVDILHRYSEYLYGVRESDHDPVLIQIGF
jgi:predicted extracellular nuclease